MPTNLLLGIDIGTSGSKALLVDLDGNILASAMAEYPMYTPRPLWAEQDPRDNDDIFHRDAFCLAEAKWKGNS